MTASTDPARYAFEYPDQGGYPDGTGTLSLIDPLHPGVTRPTHRA